MFDGKTDFRTRSTTGNKNAGLTLLDMRHYVLMLEHGFVKQTALALNMNANYMRGSISALNKIAGRPLFTEEWRGIYGRRVDATPFGLALYAIFKDIIIRWDNCMHLLEAVAPKDYQLAHKCTYGTPFDVDGNWQSQLLELFPGVFDGERGFDIQVAVAESNPFPVGVVYDGTNRVDRGFWNCRYKTFNERKERVVRGESGRQEGSVQDTPKPDSMACKSSEER